jgi:hypothetical protein
VIEQTVFKELGSDGATAYGKAASMLFDVNPPCRAMLSMGDSRRPL